MKECNSHTILLTHICEISESVCARVACVSCVVRFRGPSTAAFLVDLFTLAWSLVVQNALRYALSIQYGCTR